MYQDESDCHEEYEDSYVPDRDVTDWKRYPAHILREDSNCFWQKKIRNEIYADITEYTINDKEFYELSIQIPEEVSPTLMTINICSFHYTKLDFDLIEKHANKLINSLI